MLHVRKTLSRKEREEYEKWLAKHRAETAAFEKANKGTKSQREALASSYWLKESRERDLRSTLRNSTEVPSKPILPDPLPAVGKYDHLKDLDDAQREELRQREEAARLEILEKQARTGPAYNKGGDVYWTPEMLESLRGGGHRRR